MVKITPLTHEKAPKLIKICDENLILLQANVLEISRGYANVEQTTNAIDIALDCVSEWAANLDATMFQHNLEHQPGFIRENLDVFHRFQAMVHLKETLEDFKKDPYLYDLRYKKEIVPKKEVIDPRYYSISRKGHKRPPRLWCVSYLGKVVTDPDIQYYLDHVKKGEDVTRFNLNDDYLSDGYKCFEIQGFDSVEYSTCIQVYFENGATVNDVKELFPESCIYRGKAAQEFFNQHIKEYYGPEYNPDLWYYIDRT